MDALFANAGDLVNGLALVIAGASALANFTKTDVDNNALAAISKIINFLALNIKK